MTLYFDGNLGKRCIAHPHSTEAAVEIINDFLKEHQYKSYYLRTCTDLNGVIHYDAGSHTEYFMLVQDDSCDDEPVFWKLEDWLLYEDKQKKKKK